MFFFSFFRSAWDQKSLPRIILICAKKRNLAQTNANKRELSAINLNLWKFILIAICSQTKFNPSAMQCEHIATNMNLRKFTLLCESSRWFALVCASLRFFAHFSVILEKLFWSKTDLKIEKKCHFAHFSRTPHCSMIFRFSKITAFCFLSEHMRRQRELWKCTHFLAVATNGSSSVVARRDIKVSYERTTKESTVERCSTISETAVTTKATHKSMHQGLQQPQHIIAIV